jgi:hypothetical protein
MRYDDSTGIGDRKLASAAGPRKTRKSRGNNSVKCQRGLGSNLCFDVTP